MNLINRIESFASMYTIVQDWCLTSENYIPNLNCKDMQ